MARFRLGAYITSTFGTEDWRHFRLCGMDEVGRGAFAGPLVAAAVVLPPGFRHPWLRDSKKLTPHQREVVAEKVHRQAVALSIAEISAADINRRGLGWANVEIFRRLTAEIEADGYCCDGRLRIDAIHPVHCLVKGDDLVPAISAASIVAKVHRDALMCRLHADAPEYAWASNKGYGAPEHRAAILLHGLHAEHRLVFVDDLFQLELGLDLSGAVVPITLLEEDGWMAGAAEVAPEEADALPAASEVVTAAACAMGAGSDLPASGACIRATEGDPPAAGTYAMAAEDSHPPGDADAVPAGVDGPARV